MQTSLNLPMLDVEKISAAKMETSPYPYFILSNVIQEPWKQRLIEAYPNIKAPGSFPLSSVSCSSDFMNLIEEMNSEPFRRTIEKKFAVDLKDKPTMFTVRGKCRLKDGKVHTDSESKIITVLLYMNPLWESHGGRLRVLRSTNIEDVAAEVSPEIGTLLIFKVSDHSYHGHLPFEGVRRVIQMNWVTEQKFVDQEQKRHRWSAFFKMFKSSY